MRNNRTKYIEMALSRFVLGLYFNILTTRRRTGTPRAARVARRADEMADAVKHVLVAFRPTYQPVRDLTYLLDYALWGRTERRDLRNAHLQSLVLYLLMVLAVDLPPGALQGLVDDESLAFVWRPHGDCSPCTSPRGECGRIYGRKEAITRDLPS